MTPDKVLIGSDGVIILVSTVGEICIYILAYVYDLIVGIDEGTGIGYLVTSFDDSNE